MKTRDNKPAAAADEKKTFTILHTNDMHTSFIGMGPAADYTPFSLNGDATLYGGSGVGNLGGVMASPIPAHGRTHSLTVTLPPLAVVMFKG